MKTYKMITVLALVVSAFVLTGCYKDEINTSDFKIINNGGAVSEIVLDQNGKPLEIVQTIPSFENNESKSISKANAEFTRSNSRIQVSTQQIQTKASWNSFPTNLPIMFFFNNKIYLNSIKNNFEVTVGGTEVKGTIVVNVTPAGNAIITFTPWKEFAASKDVVITIKKGMQSSGGKEMLQDIILSYVTTQSVKGDFDSNKDFEKGDDGCFFAGDGAVRTGTTGPLGPHGGNRFAAISTGDYLVSDNGRAVGGASSLLVLGPIHTNISTLSFYYDFISAEFNDYVNSVYDDCAIVTIYGPRGSYSELVSSVNTVKYDNKPFVGYPNMPDDGDSYAGHTGWLPYNISATKMGSIGSPAYIIFTVTDVSDLIFSSILTIDNISY